MKATQRTKLEAYSPGNRVNIYLDDKYFKIWNSIPKMRRSKWIREQLKQYETRND